MAKINEAGDFNNDIEASIKEGIEKFKTTQTWWCHAGGGVTPRCPNR